MKSLAAVMLCSVVIVAPAVCADTALGRLFTDAAERRALDKMRAARDLPPPELPPVIEVPEVVEPEPGVPEIDKPVVHVEGYVKRRGTSGTVWINGINSYDGDLRPAQIDPQRVRIVGDRVRLAPLDRESPVSLKPGQAFDPSRGEVADSYRLMPSGEGAAADRHR